ncbi:uncharacterized protein LOC106400053 isoform X3 [Brassica napus]|uniref:uncharacterized protein LOC106400053 isoform X3 n=1 Tax=Brassica napus TaxID=3708 RepID=UPI00207AF3ED|nr:uncharacterized protein LOC106400053 isoform X3 [Brassica napus]
MLMQFIGYSEAAKDPEMQGIYSNASSLNARPSNSSTLNQTMNVSRPRKRKDSTFLQSPWNKVYLQPSELCHSISVSEQEWALAANTLCEKVILSLILITSSFTKQSLSSNKEFFFCCCWLVPSDAKIDPNEVVSSSKKRLVFSTNLMQQLLQPAPTFVFSDIKSAFNYEIMLYFESRITLADACSLTCHSDFDKSTKKEDIVHLSKLSWRSCNTSKRTSKAGRVPHRY